MARNPSCTVYVGNLDEKVTDRILYEILIQVGHVVDLYIPRDKETNSHKGYAFAEYESEEVAEYAVRLFSGLVRLHNRTLKFAISGQDKPSQNTRTPVAPKMNLTPVLKPHSMNGREVDVFQGSAQSTDCKVSAYTHPATPVTPKTSPPFLFHGSGQSTDCRLSTYTHLATPVTTKPNSPLLFPDSALSTDYRVSAYTHSVTPVTPKTNAPLPLHGSAWSNDCRVSAHTHLVTPVTSETNPPFLAHGSLQSTDCRVSAYTHSATPVTPKPNSPHPPRPYPLHSREMAIFQELSQPVNCRISAYSHSVSPGYPQASARGFVNNGVNSSNFDYSRQVFGPMLINSNRPDSQHPTLHPSFLQ